MVNTNLRRKQRLIVQLRLNPCQEIIDVFGRGALDGALDRLPICPQILVSLEEIRRAKRNQKKQIVYNDKWVRDHLKEITTEIEIEFATKTKQK